MKTVIRVQREDFDAAAEIDALAQGGAAIGAVATFSGYVRAEAGLTSLTLEHYPAMTEREIARHVELAKARWPLLGVTIVHRVGRLAPGERIVFVATASPHRAAAFAACEFLMDYLKVHAPFWKRDERETGSCWVESKAIDDEAVRRWR